MSGQVRGELGPEDLGIEVARRGAGRQRGEEQRREADADRGVASEQRHRDPDEGDCVEISTSCSRPVLPAEDVETCRETGEPPEIAIARKKFLPTQMPP